MKNTDLLGQWNLRIGWNLHSVQLNILRRALCLLGMRSGSSFETSVNPVVVYSTCSMNPLENEAVVMNSSLSAIGFARMPIWRSAFTEKHFRSVADSMESIGTRRDDIGECSQCDADYQGTKAYSAVCIFCIANAIDRISPLNHAPVDLQNAFIPGVLNVAECTLSGPMTSWNVPKVLKPKRDSQKYRGKVVKNIRTICLTNVL